MPDSFTDAVERELEKARQGIKKGYAPKGLYDRRLSSELAKLDPLPDESRPQRDGKNAGETVVYTDPKTGREAFEAWVWYPPTNKNKGTWRKHGSSRVPEYVKNHPDASPLLKKSAGVILKSPDHPTFWKEAKHGRKAGYKLEWDKERGEYRSAPSRPSYSGPLKPEIGE
tara:strand:- start:8127 stop:8636 length:510 start_codon:yes stop_codon:yes gene_type:complete